MTRLGDLEIVEASLTASLFEMESSVSRLQDEKTFLGEQLHQLTRQDVAASQQEKQALHDTIDAQSRQIMSLEGELARCPTEPTHTQ